MTRIRCHFIDCVFLDDRFCSANVIELDPDRNCLTYTPNTGKFPDEEDWDDVDDLDDDDWEDLGFEEEEEEDDDLWLDDGDFE